MMKLTVLLLLLWPALMDALTINCNVECDDDDKKIVSFLNYETCLPFDTKKSDVTPPAPQLVGANWFIDSKTNYIRLNVTFRQHKLQIADGYYFKIWHSGWYGDEIEFCLRINKTELNKLTQSLNDSLVYFNYNCYGSDPDWGVTPMDSENKDYIATIYPQPLYAENNSDHSLEINLLMPDCCEDKYEDTINCQEHYYDYDCGPLYSYDDVTTTTKQLQNNSHKIFDEKIYIAVVSIGLVVMAMLIFTAFYVCNWKKTTLRNCGDHLVLFIVDHDDNKTKADKIVNHLQEKLKLQVKCYWRDGLGMNIVNYLSMWEPKCSAIIFLCFGNHKNENPDGNSLAKTCFENSRNVKVVLACKAGKSKHDCISNRETFIKKVPHSQLQKKLCSKLRPMQKDVPESETLVTILPVSDTNGHVANGNDMNTNDQLLNSNESAL